jgi:DNA-directed RNA polymerase subunit RPC12/RpoP
MQVIEVPDGDERQILTGSVGPLFYGPGQTDYVCGECETLLVRGANPWMLTGLLVRCPTCGKINEPQ